MRPDQDSGGFKGIFARWALTFTRDNHITSYDSWFRLNADMAWSQRSAAGIVDWHWTAKTGGGALYSWDCSPAVAMMEALLPARGRCNCPFATRMLHARGGPQAKTPPARVQPHLSARAAAAGTASAPRLLRAAPRAARLG
jgi:hypothetical protein